MITAKEQRRCFNCLWFATVDTGYSNYTVEGTTCHCLKNNNPNFPCEECYSWEYPESDTTDAKAVKVAIECQNFCDTDGRSQIRMDVEGYTKLEDFCAELQQAAKSYGCL